MKRPPTTTSRGPGRSMLAVAGLVAGMGLGGFLDGIVLHQILQWHNMISFRLPPETLEAMRANMVWDGVFHLGVWLLTAAGIGLLWRAARRGGIAGMGPAFGGGLVAGWGVFNLLEGLVNHQMLELHHVNEQAQHMLAWDLAFLAFGALLIFAGWSIMRSGAARAS